MDLFGASNIEKMVAEHDMEGLYRLLQHNNSGTRLEAAMALAELNDGAGWRYLMDTVQQPADRESQLMAASMLGELGHPRAIPVLEKALKTARLKVDREAAQTLKEALEAIGGRDADDALRRSGYEPVLPHMTSNLQVVDYDGEYVPTITPDSLQVEYLTSEQHLNNAVSLRESELAERGLVEDSLALWLSPEMAYAWYIRGVLYEDLERSFEAALCYRWALELDPGQADAREALGDLEAEQSSGQNPFSSLTPALLLADLSSRHWKERRDAVAGLGDLGEKAPAEAVDRLIELLDDEDREVRHAAIEALGNIGDKRAVLPLSQCDESSWLLRFALIEALAQLGSVDGLAVVLQREMNRDQMRNPVFSAQKDPLLEVEYSRLMEICVLAFEKTGDLQGLLTLAEGNAWEEVDETDTSGEQEADMSEEEEYTAEGVSTGDEEEYLDEEEDIEADEDLESYVDEVAQMECMALERMAMPQLAALDVATLRRLAAVPDLSLLELSGEEEEDDGASDESTSEPELTVIYDLSALREAAKAELAGR